jgi:uncharacterized membrane protein
LSPSVALEPVKMMAKKRSNALKVDTEAGPWLFRFARGHVRLWAAAAIGIAGYTLAPPSLVFSTRLLIGWDVGIVCYLIILAVTMARASPSDIRYHSAMQDEGAYALLLLAVAASLVSLGAIFAELVGIDQSQPNYGFHVALALATVTLSWTFMHAMFALHYAHDFYGTGRRARGLKFPGDEPPDYWDFIYFSFVIGMTFQVSDVGVANRWIRRTVVAHGALSFVFTATILSLAVNIAASLVGR